MLQKLGLLGIVTAVNFCATGHPIWGMCTLMVAGLLLRGSGMLKPLGLKAIEDVKLIFRRLRAEK